MKVKELEEGFLDTVLSKIQSAAGKVGLDNISSFFSALRGGNVSLDKVARAIADRTFASITGARTDLNAKSPGDQVPLDKVIAAAFSAAANISKTSDTLVITNIELIEYFKKHKADILKGVNTVAKGASNASETANLISSYITSKTAPEGDENITLQQYIDNISLVVAITILHAEFAYMNDIGISGSASSPTKSEPVEVDFTPALLSAFKNTGNTINTSLLTPRSSLHVALGADNNFKQNLGNLVLQIVGSLKSTYVNMPTDRLTAVAVRPPVIINRNRIQAALLGHLPTEQDSPERTAELKSLVDNATRGFNKLTSSWIKLAAEERNLVPDSSASNEAYAILHNWAKEALALVDSITPAKQGKA
jgi:hypothetical protein